jgi:hypothetical protein
MTDRSNSYEFLVKDVKMDEEDFLVFVFERKERPHVSKVPNVT